jgi:hypothetical protein
MSQSRVREVDDAFNLLLVIIGIVFSIYNSHYRILLPEDSPERVVQILIRMTVIPLLVLTFIWIAAKLTRNENYAVLLKLVDWMVAINLTAGVLFMYFRETGYVLGDYENYFTIIMILLVPIFVYFAVVPRYRDMYPDASFFNNNWKFIVVAIISTALWRATLWFATGSFA